MTHAFVDSVKAVFMYSRKSECDILPWFKVSALCSLQHQQHATPNITITITIIITITLSVRCSETETQLQLHCR
jgi:hypothetical protein